jgi:putative peptidoglycan lipid II flippase
MIPMTAGAIILRVPIVSILFQRGEFDSRATMLTASALLFYSLGMVFFGYRDILSRVFYSLNDTKTPMINGVIALICNILLNIILVQYMQHAGLAFATSITAAITTILLFISLKKKLGSIGTISIVKVFIKSCIAAITMGVTVYNLNIYINSIIITESITSKLLTLSLNIGVGVIIYSTVIYFSKIDEISWIIGLVKNKLNLK